jgi:hypothetical protein
MASKKDKVPRKMFTPQEDALIVMLVENFGQKNWQLIAKALINRTPRQVRERFRNYLSPGLTNGPWSRNEDELLKNLYFEYGPKWSKISTFFKSRSDVNIKNRWSSISKLFQPISSPEISLPKQDDSKEKVHEPDPIGFPALQFDIHHDIFEPNFSSEWNFCVPE